MTSEFLLGKDGGGREEKVGRGGEGREDWRMEGRRKEGQEKEGWEEGGGEEEE